MPLKLAYLGLTLVTLCFLFAIGYKAIKQTSKHFKRDLLILILGLALWQLYIQVLASTDLLQSYTFPPRFALAFIIPSFIFTGVFLYTNRNKSWIHAIPQSWVIYFQSFRVLVETLFIFSVAEGLLNPQVTLEGYNVDMLFAATAPMMAYMVYTKKAWPKRAIVFWNYLGLAVIASIIFLFLTSIYKPEIFGSTAPLIPMAAFSYPYVLIAGFLMPTAVFLHILSLVQIKKSGLS